LHEYWLATGATWAQEAAAGAAELFLSHRLFRSLSDGEVIDRRWLALHYPPYWHYDVLQALLILLRLNSTRSLGQIRGLSGHAAGADCAA
jgi:hypothetical protein